jgi:hypothetical protein
MQNDLSNQPRLSKPGLSGNHSSSTHDTWALPQREYQKSRGLDDLAPAQGLLSSIAVSSLLWAILAFVPVIVRCTVT